MKLSQAASFFDRTLARDPDNGDVLFRCQVDPYDDSKRDAGAAYRRVLSVKPGTEVAPVVRIFDDVWVVGRSETDGLGSQHRVKYVLQPAPVRAAVSRFTDFLEGVPSLHAWLGIEWIKDGKELDTSSSIPQTYNAFAPLQADLRKHDIIGYDGFAYLVMATHAQPSGFLVASCIRLEQLQPEPAQLAPRQYDPVAGRYIDGAPLTVPTLRVRWQSLFTYGSQSDVRYQEGDVSLLVPPATALDTSAVVTVGGVAYSVLSVDRTSGALVAHGRPQRC